MIFWNSKSIFENPVMFKFIKTKHMMKDINGGKNCVFEDSNDAVMLMDLNKAYDSQIMCGWDLRKLKYNLPYIALERNCS